MIEVCKITVEVIGNEAIFTLTHYDKIRVVKVDAEHYRKNKTSCTKTVCMTLSEAMFN